MPEYQIDVGNSTTGPVGFVAYVTADNPEKALEKLRQHCPEAHEIELEEIELIAYFNPKAVTLGDVMEEL